MDYNELLNKEGLNTLVAEIKKFLNPGADPGGFADILFQEVNGTGGLPNNGNTTTIYIVHSQTSDDQPIVEVYRWNGVTRTYNKITRDWKNIELISGGNAASPRTIQT